MKRSAACRLLLGVSLATAMAGCGDAGDRAPSAPRASNIAAVIKGLDNPFFKTMRDGLLATARTYHARLHVEAAAGQSDAAGQASRLESQVPRRNTCYVVNPINQANLIQPLSRVAAGTPIVNIDSPVAQRQAAAVGVKITAYVGTNNVAAGRAGATAMAALLPPGGRVAVVTGPPGDATSDARIDGFRAGAEGHFKVVESAAADFDRRKAMLAAEDLLRADPHIDGFFAANDLMALGIAKIAKRTVKVIGVDGIDEALTAVKRGAMSGTVAQYPYTIGQLGVEACLAAARGKHIPARIDAPIQVVTKDNVDRAKANFPKPIEPFANPLTKLLER
jgi:ABC-type sugar transport system substrate-binding protein